MDTIQQFLAALIRIAVALERIASSQILLPAPPPTPIPAPTTDFDALVPAGATLFFSDTLDKQTVGPIPDDTIPALTGEIWESGKQPNAWVNVVSLTNQKVLEVGLERVHSIGQTGARAFFSGRAWNRLKPLYGKKAWLLWQTRISKTIPVQQGEGNFCTLGVEGKMGNLGIWACNMEIVNGQMLPWLQNSSNKQWVFSAKERDPLPVGVWYPSAIQMLATDDPAQGWMKWHTGKTVISADKVATIGLGGGLGAAFCLYVGQGKDVLLGDEPYTVQFKDIRLYIEG